MEHFGTWLRQIIDEIGIKHIKVAEVAEMNPGSLSRILSTGKAQRASVAKLVHTINQIAGREVADLDKALLLAIGIDSVEDNELLQRAKGIAKGLLKVPEPERQVIEDAINGILSKYDKEEHDTDYIED